MRRIICLLLIVLISYTSVIMLKNNTINNRLDEEITKMEISNEEIITNEISKLNKSKEGKEDKIKELESIKQCNQEIENLMQ